MGWNGNVIVKDGKVLRWSTFFGRYVESSFPAVDLARHDAVQQVLKGKEVFPGFTDAEREVAQRFDVNKVLADIVSARKAAGLPADIDKK